MFLFFKSGSLKLHKETLPLVISNVQNNTSCVIQVLRYTKVIPDAMMWLRNPYFSSKARR